MNSPIIFSDQENKKSSYVIFDIYDIYAIFAM